MSGRKHGDGCSAAAIRAGDSISANAGGVRETSSDGSLGLVAQLGYGGGGRGTTGAVIEAEIVEGVDVKVVANGRVEGGRGANLVESGNISTVWVREPGRRKDGGTECVAEAAGGQGCEGA